MSGVLLGRLFSDVDFPDSLGECVSTLSKRFSATESFSDALSGISHSHKNRHSELRHRKEAYIQHDTAKTKVMKLVFEFFYYFPLQSCIRSNK